VKKVQIFTDGACSGNPGIGGWGAILRCGNNEKEICGGTERTTNNRMELKAVIAALESLNQGCEVSITTDSKYVMNGITQWIENWIRNGWRTRDRKEVKNRDLWQVLHEVSAKHKVSWHWIRGHSGHAENERCDKLATGWVEKFKRKSRVKNKPGSTEVEVYKKSGF